MKRNGSFIFDNLSEIKRIDSEFTGTIEIVNDSLNSSPLKDTSNLKEEIRETRRIKGVLVMYDMSLIPNYDGCIGSAIHSQCSHTSVPIAGKTVLREEKEAPIDVYSNEHENETKSFIGKELQDLNKEWNGYLSELKESSTVYFSTNAGRFKVLYWLVNSCQYLNQSTECEILAISIYNTLCSIHPNTNLQLLAAVSVYYAGKVTKASNYEGTPLLLAERSLFSFSKEDVLSLGQTLPHTAIPLCYPQVMQLLQTVKASPILLFSSLYFLECSLVSGGISSCSVKELCEGCLKNAMQKIGEITELSWTVSKEVETMISEAPNMLCQQHCNVVIKDDHLS